MLFLSVGKELNASSLFSPLLCINEYSLFPSFLLITRERERERERDEKRGNQNENEIVRNIAS